MTPDRRREPPPRRLETEDGPLHVRELPMVAPMRARSYEEVKRARPRDFAARLLIGAPLAPTREEWARVLRALSQGDAPMDKVVAWMFESGAKTAKALFEQALTRGIDTVEDPPAPLAEFFAHVDQIPPWLDRALLDHASAFAQACGDVLLYVLRDLALMPGYANFNSMNQTLAATGVLARDVSRRIGETGKWLADVNGPNGLDRFGDGFISTIRVRLVHALVRRAVLRRDDWDSETWGLPVNQLDMVATYLAFGPMTVTGVRLFGVPVRKQDARATMHLWRYVGWLSGVEERWLALTERDGWRTLRHIALTNRLPDDKVRVLGQALLEEPLSRRVSGAERFPRWAWLARRYTYHKHLSNSALVLGWKQRRRLGLPLWAVPWYPMLSAPLRFVVHVAHRAFGKVGREKLRRRGAAKQQRLLASYLGDHPARIIDPKHDHPTHVG